MTSTQRLFLLGLLAVACTATSPPTLPSWHDLLFHASLDPEHTMEDAYCADEARWARPLANGETLSVPIEIDGTTRLTLGGCRGRTGPHDTLDLRVEIEGTVTDRLRISTGPEATWWRRSFDLTHLPSGPAELVLDTRLDGGQFFLRELVVNQDQPVDIPTSPAPKILLISIDTLRADLERWETPNLDQLATEATFYTHSWAASHWTKPSHATLLTGERPSVHGATLQVRGIHPALPTVAEHLADAGWATGALVHDCVHLEPRFGFARGFTDYQVSRRTPEQQVHATLAWLRDHRDQPAFYFLHNYDVHSDFVRLPYESPPADGRWVMRNFGVEGYGCTGARCASARLAMITRGKIEPIDGEAEILDALYGLGISHVDRHLGMLFDGLRELGLWDETMIVVTSDHGEALLERDRLTMHDEHWDEVLRVPLWIKWPRGERGGERVDLPVSGLDVAPTVLAAAGLDPDSLPGNDLATLRRLRPLFLGYGPLRTVVDLPYKFTRSTIGDELDFRLFDLHDDPAERDNLFPGDQARIAELAALAQQISEQDRRHRAELDQLAAPIGAQELSPEERSRLQALGYLD